MGRTVRHVRPFVAALFVLQLNLHCSSQPSPVLPLNRFGTKNTYNNKYCEQDGSDSPSVEETEFCCAPVQVDELSVNLYKIRDVRNRFKKNLVGFGSE